jgi:hypothetical protein
MANRIYIIPRRNDLAGVGLNLNDLKPNAGQKNNIYDGEHQNVYVAEPLDQFGTTTVDGLVYVSGSKNTTLTADAVADDTTGSGNDVTAMQATTFGLAAYLKDRVHRAGIAAADNGEFAFGECNSAALLIIADVEAGVSLTLARINAHLATTVAQTDLTGASGDSKSFGSVVDILRILSGEVYRLPKLSIIENVAGQFRSLAERQVFVAAQTAAMIAAQGQFYASGSFLDADDVGYQARPTMVETSAVNLSLASGVLAAYKGNITVLNPDFAYSAGAVTAWRPRARDIAGNAIATKGLHQVLAVYNGDGEVL